MRAEPRKAKLLNAQIMAALYSVLFLASIYYGYKNLLAAQGPFLQYGVSIILPLTAWSIARYIGNDEQGVRGNLPAFGLLLVISAVGIFNTLMLNLEGKRIFEQSIDRGLDRYTALETAARLEQKAKGIVDKRKEIERLKVALTEEISHEANCGRGPEAQKILLEIKQVLVDFQLPSGKVNCKDKSSVANYVDSYSRVFDIALDNADWNTPALDRIIRESGEGKEALNCMLSGCDANPDLQASLRDINVKRSPVSDIIEVIVPQLELSEAKYKSNRALLAESGGTFTSVQPNLGFDEIRYVGQIGQLSNLILERADRITTYIYLLAAFAFDWLMVYFFSLVRRHRLPRQDANLALGGAW